MTTLWDARDRRAGYFILAAATIIVGTLIWLSLDVSSPEERWYVSFDRVEGLTVQAPVRVEGFTVGYVTAIVPQVDSTGRVRFLATLRIPVRGQPIPLPPGTIVRLVPPVVGQANLELVRPANATGSLPAGSTLPGEVQAGLLAELNTTVLELRATAATTTASVVLLTDSLVHILGEVRDDGRGIIRAVHPVIARAESTLMAYQRDAEAIYGVIASTQPIPAQVSALVDSVGRMAEEARRAMARVEEGVAARTPEITRIVARLDTTTTHLNYVLKRYARRPLRFFTGIDTTAFPAPASVP
jgi:ABC-type transporter Mla subunit MlaD